MSPFSVGLEATATLAHRFTGVPRYALELSRALAALGAPDLRCRMLFRLASFRKRELMAAYPWPTRWYASGPWPAMPRCDVVHALATRLPHRTGRAARVSTLHDLSPFMLPNYGSDRGLRNSQQSYRDAATADRLIAVSQATKDDYLRLFPIAAERIDVIHHGLPDVFFAPRSARQPRASAAPPYLVVFGGNPRKNLARTIEAFAISASRKHLQLRVVGTPDPASAAALRASGGADSVRLVQIDDDAAMVDLYRGSVGLVFASLQEGFGFPLLEAMASSVPVLTSARPGTAEIAGGHATLVDPESVESIAAGIDRLPGAGADEHALAAAAAYARTFTWRRCAERTLDVDRAVAG